MLTGNRLLPFLYIEELGLTIYPLELEGCWIHPFALHLATDYRSLKSDNTKVMTVSSLNYDKISGLDALTGSVSVYSLAGILEADHIKVLELLLINSCKPIIYLKLAATLPICTLQLAGIRPLYHTAAGAVKFL